MTRAVVCAYSPVGHAALEGLLATGIEVTALYTYPQTAEDNWFEAPESLAKRHDIPVRMAADFNTDAVFADIQREAPDLLLSFYFREMIQGRFLELPPLGAYNLHGSLLPAYRGRAPINWALAHGATQSGITLHQMTPRPDDGHIIGQTPLAIAWDESALSLTWRMAEAGRELVRRCLPQLVQGKIKPTPQAELGPASYFGRRSPQDSQLHFAMGVAEAFNQIRAVADPWPNAFLETSQGQIHIPWALPSASPCPPGAYRKTNEGVLLGFADAALRLHAMKYQGTRSERPSDHSRWLDELGIPEHHD